MFTASKSTIALIAALGLTAGCSSTGGSNGAGSALVTTLGAGLGAVGGGALGSLVGSGTGKTLATAGGSVVGGGLGAYAARSYLASEPQTAAAQPQAQYQTQAPQYQQQAPQYQTPQYQVQPAPATFSQAAPTFQTVQPQPASVVTYDAAPTSFKTIQPAVASSELSYTQPTSVSTYTAAPAATSVYSQPTLPTAYAQPAASSYVKPLMIESDIPTSFTGSVPSAATQLGTQAVSSQFGAPSFNTAVLPTASAPTLSGAVPSIQSAAPTPAYVIQSPSLSQPTTATFPTF